VVRTWVHAIRGRAVSCVPEGRQNGAMLSVNGWCEMTDIHSLQSSIDLQNWKDLENRADSDQDSRLTNPVPAVSRLLGG
jgi:hypothetical protein